MSNENGFIYPTTLILFLLLCFSISFHANAYLSEKRYVTEQEHLLLLESLLQIAVVDFSKFNKENTVDETLVFSYEHGTVKLVIQEQEEFVYVLMSAELPTGHKRSARFFFNTVTNELEEYWEVS